MITDDSNRQESRGRAVSVHFIDWCSVHFKEVAGDVIKQWFSTFFIPCTPSTVIHR